MEYELTDEWYLEKKISKGSFSEIFKGHNKATKQEVAVKLEKVSCNINQVLHEAKILKRLEPTLGFPRVYWYGATKDFNLAVLDLLGPSLQDIFISSNKRLGLKTVLIIAEQLISRVQALHSYHYLHRDIKPENILLGRGKLCNLIYLIDFGLSKKFKNSKKAHISYRDDKGFTGNQKFCSKNSLIGIEQGRRDDLEAIGYVLLYLLKGKLPWEIPLKVNATRRLTLSEIKITVSLESLCKDCPGSFYTYMSYARSLSFSSKPDYSYIKKLFRETFVQNELIYDNIAELYSPKQSQLQNISFSPNDIQKYSKAFDNISILETDTHDPAKIKPFEIENHCWEKKDCVCSIF
jgi:casein kinase 1